MIRQNEVAVLGGGISGLTCGIRLRQAGYPVRLFARELSPHTTSDVAAAFWYPLTAVFSPHVSSWATASQHTFAQLAQQPESGVTFKPLLDLFAAEALIPDWQSISADATPVSRSYHGQTWRGFRVQVPAIDTSVYMPFIMDWFLRLGGQVERRAVADLSELSARYDLVINCSGVWARELCADTAVYPIRGQVIQVQKPAGLPDEILHIDEGDTVTYIVPRRHDCILGGTKQAHSWNLQPDEEDTAAILQRCAHYQPLLRNPTIIAQRVGLRPGRTAVRLERQQQGKAAIIHNYGHGAIGHTLSWGCAAEVVQLAAA